MRRSVLLLFAAFFGLLSIAGDQVVFQIEKIINRLQERQNTLEEKLTENSSKLVADTYHLREAFFDQNHSIVLLLGNLVQLENNHLRGREFRKKLQMGLGKTEEQAEAEEQEFLKKRRNEIGAEFRDDLTAVNTVLNMYIDEFIFDCQPSLFYQSNCSEAFNNKARKTSGLSKLDLIERAQLKLSLFEDFLIISQRDIEELNDAISSLIDQISNLKLFRQLMLISTLVFNLLSLMTVFIYFRQLIAIAVSQSEDDKLNRI